MSAHTPGPWVVANPDHDELVIVAATGTDDAEDVAVLFAHPANHPNAPANARLVAVSPELLSMLVETTARLNLCGTGPRDLDIVERANALIAKARGVR